ncbi:hypothetical protein M885DRAFT_547937 [Pelagophyceae sp. CCMP2097]|nr:hypothetical protein M885DRAFT_547937 [Pelagophyceae sp. CCMP2097]
MNQRRRSYVERLYSTLGDEKTLTARTMCAAFDAEAHPDVIAGNRTADDVREELDESLRSGGGAVSEVLFVAYYDIQSISIDSDDQFEALVRSGWIALVRTIAKAKKAAKAAAATTVEAQKASQAQKAEAAPKPAKS